MIHTCDMCGTEAAWIDDGGPPDGWIFLDRYAEPLCGECLGSLGLGPRAREIAIWTSQLRQSPSLSAIDRLQVPPEDEPVLRWLGFGPVFGVDLVGLTWRWTRDAVAFAALAPVRQALCSRDFKRRFGPLP